MHEFATAQALIKTIKGVIKKQNIRKIHRVEMAIGELTFLAPERLSFWIKEGLKGTAGEVARIKIEVIPSQIKCEPCGYAGKIEVKEEACHLSPLVFACPKCGSDKIKIITGKECHLKAMEVD